MLLMVLSRQSAAQAENTKPSGISEHIEFCMLIAVERLAVGLRASETRRTKLTGQI